MQRGERPCRLGVLIVDHDQWGDIVGESETAEYFYGDIRVVGAEVPQEEDVDAAGLDCLPEVRECFIGVLVARYRARLKLSRSAIRAASSGAGSSMVAELTNSSGSALSSSSIDRMSPCACFDVAYEGVEFRVELLMAGQGAEVLPTISRFGWFCQVEDQERPTVRLGHLQQDGACWFVLAKFHGFKPSPSSTSAGICEAERTCGIIERQTGGLSCPPQDFWLYRAHTTDLYFY